LNFRLFLFDKFNNLIKSSKHPRSSVILFITKNTFSNEINLIKNKYLPNLKQIFEGQSTGFDEHVLSSPVQH
jgi:hypothetical protein